MDLKTLRSQLPGETVWVLGSGATLNHLRPRFFDGKPVVATNYAGQVLGIRPQFVFTHYHDDARELADTANVVVTLECDTLSQRPWQGPVPPNMVFCPQDSYQPPGSAWDPFDRHRPRPDSLVYGSSSIHGAMHLAAWLGAAHIVMVGADCGTLDGQHRVSGYPEGADTPWTLYDRHHRRMKEWLVHRYGVTVYSLNPFVNLNLEGHVFVGG